MMVLSIQYINKASIVAIRILYQARRMMYNPNPVTQKDMTIRFAEEVLIHDQDFKASNSVRKRCGHHPICTPYGASYAHMRDFARRYPQWNEVLGIATYRQYIEDGTVKANAAIKCTGSRSSSVSRSLRKYQTRNH
jgi:hypothetical protein